MSPNTIRYLTIDAVCARLECTRPTIMKIIERGDLAAIKFGGSWGVSPEEFERYLASAAEAERKKNADLAKERAAQRRKALLANQSAAEIEARQIRQEIYRDHDTATIALARFSAAVRRAHSIDDDGRRA